MFRERIRSAFSWLSVHASSVSSWAAVLLTGASTLVAYGVVLPGHTPYRVLGAAVALLTVLAARSSQPPPGRLPPGN